MKTVKESLDKTAEKDNINPDYYTNQYPIEVWDMMIHIWGKEKFIAFCEMSAFAYRLRAGKKSDNFVEDIEKAKRYEAKIKELSEK